MSSLVLHYRLDVMIGKTSGLREILLRSPVGTRFDVIFSCKAWSNTSCCIALIIDITSVITIVLI